MGACCSVILGVTHFSGSAALRRRLPGTGPTLGGGSSQDTTQCQELLCLLLAIWEQCPMQAKPPFKVCCELRHSRASWLWLPVMALSPTAPSSCLWLHGSRARSCSRRELLSPAVYAVILDISQWWRGLHHRGGCPFPPPCKLKVNETRAGNVSFSLVLRMRDLGPLKEPLSKVLAKMVLI